MAEEWVRGIRGLDAKPGPWHLVVPRGQRTWSGSRLAECGVYPNRNHQAVYERPNDGKFCPKCLNAAERRGGAA